MGSVETFITSLFDMIPILKSKRWIRFSSIVGIIAIYFGLGVIFCFQSGTYWLELFDTYSGNWAIFVIAALESISIGWLYGIKF